MERKQPWTEEQFEFLLTHPELTHAELSNAPLLSQTPPPLQRTEDAIETVRSFLHSFHQGGDISGLSQPMRRVLNDEQRGPITCWKCGANF